MFTPLVAIKCTVYNHEPFLRECLDGFVMQQTDFPFVAVVHDDASTDKSADIIREYAAKYPDIIQPYYETENQYSKETLSRVMNEAVDATGAKYIALCEGDDYWTDPHKLQKQVDFLESHPDYGFVGTQCRVLDEMGYNNGSDIVLTPLRQEGNWDLFGNVLEYAVYGPIASTNTLLFRYDSKVYDRIKEANGDYTLEALLASLYGFARLNEVCSVYRRHEGGLSNSHSPRIRRMYAEWYRSNRLLIKKEFANIYACSKEEIDDTYEYTLLKCAIAEGFYKEAFEHKQKIVTKKYKAKFYCKYLLGIFSFALLRITLKINELRPKK